jgi:mannosyltransferase OCH1-like enzyme
MFSDSMKNSYDYVNLKTSIDQWNIIESRYLEHKVVKNKEQKIPKIVHQIWLGGSMPESEQKMVEQVRANLDSDWIHILWTENEIKNLKNFNNIEFYNQTPNYGQRSDLLRYNILNEMGGVYMDTDFILFKQFNELLHLDFFCGVSYDDQPSLFNGLIGSSPGNDLIKDLLILDRPLMYHDAMKLMDSTGPFFLTRKVFKHIHNNGDICVLPNSFFYPLPNFHRSKSRGEDYKNYIEKESICCHMWSSSWM